MTNRTADQRGIHPVSERSERTMNTAPSAVTTEPSASEVQS